MIKVLNISKKLLKIFLIFIGSLFLCLIIISFTDLPFYAYYNLGNNKTYCQKSPEYIVIFGAGGMPDPESLNRLYYGAKAAHRYPKSRVIIAMPSDSLKEDNPILVQMSNELIIRGIEKKRISFEYQGVNTFQQAKNTLSMFPGFKESSIYVVSSPYHLRRIIKVYKKLGVKQIGELASHDLPLNEISLESKDVLDKHSLSLSLRYNFWNYLKYEIIVIREYTALFYYKCMGWI